MTFLAPLYLLALIPFAPFALWLLIGRRRRTWVPFLPLWNAPEELRQPKKGFEPPPLSLVFAILATLLGLLAMAQPQFQPSGRAVDHGRIVIIVDRGASMSARIDRQPRFARLAADVAPQLLGSLDQGSVDLIDVATSQIKSTDRSNWPSEVAGWKRTAIDTHQSLQTTIQQQLERNFPVIVLSDQALDTTNPQLVQIKPTQPVSNAAIVAIADRPRQIMLTLRATQPLTRTLHVQSGDRAAQQAVTLKPGPDQNVFLDLDASADTVEAWFDESDDFDADNRAWLVRRQSWPIIEPRTTLPEELRRVIEVYSKNRPAAEGSLRLPIARPGDLKPDEPGIVLAQIEPLEALHGQVIARAHALTAGVDWSALAKGAALAKPPGEGWTNLATLADRPILAIREGDVRQVWVGFDSREFARTPAFVILWANIFNWTGGGAEGFAASPVTQTSATDQRLLPATLSDDIDPTLWPGVFDTVQGKLALNAAPVSFAAASDPNTWVSRLPALTLSNGAAINLAPWLALAALLCIVGAAATWEKRRTPAHRPTPHLDVETVKHVQSMVAVDGHTHRHESETRP